MPNTKVLFLTLKTFGFTGGVEKVCRTICRALFDLSEADLIVPMVYSMYDLDYERDSRYIKATQYKGFNKERKYFTVKAIFKGLTTNVVILSHINLLYIGYAIKLLSPKTKIYLIAHGIEIWKPLSNLKVKALSKIDKIIAVSNFTANKINTLHKINFNKIVVLNNSLDPFYHLPYNYNQPTALIKRYGLKKDNTVILSLCRLSSTEKYKGYDQVIKILPLLVVKHPGLIFILAGKADAHEQKRLEQLIEKHKLQKNVKLIGFLDEAEVSSHFLLADIFVMPSKKEGFGIVFIEAMASGVPVVAGNKDGSVDALKNGKLGTLIDPDNAQELSGTLQNLLDNPKTPQERVLIQTACVAEFNYERYLEKFKAIILNEI